MARRWGMLCSISLVCLGVACKRDAPTSNAPVAASQPATGSTSAMGAPRESLKKGNVPSGIYEVVALTENAKSCDEEGPSILAERPSRFLVTREATGLVELHDCKGVDDCKDHLAQLLAGKSPCERIPLMLSEQDASGIVYGKVTVTGIRFGETCKDAELKDTRFIKGADGEIRVEERTRKGSYPAVNGMCSTKAAGEALATSPCSALLVMRAKVAQPL